VHCTPPTSGYSPTKPAAGAQGALQWTFTGTLAPGAQTAVTYRVVVAQYRPRDPADIRDACLSVRIQLNDNVSSELAVAYSFIRAVHVPVRRLTINAKEAPLFEHIQGVEYDHEFHENPRRRARPGGRRDAADGCPG
jgi:hypothetical protein